MKKKMTLFLGTAVMFSLILIGCSSSPTGPSNSPPQLTTPTFAGPSSTTASADSSTGAQVAKALAIYFDSFFENFSQLFTGQATQQGNMWTWTKQSTSLSATSTILENDGSYQLNVYVTGTYGNTYYNGTDILSGTESSDGKNGNWAINLDSEISTLVWSTGSDGSLTGTFTIPGSETDVLIDKGNGGGEVKVYNGSGLKLDVTWNSSGSGQWVSYDPATGNQTGSGNWS